VASTAFAQDIKDPVDVTDKTTGIKFSMYEVPQASFTEGGSFQMGIVLPEKPGNEYIARVVANKKGYSAISHTNGMVDSLLLLYYADGNTIRHGFRMIEYVGFGLWCASLRLLTNSKCLC
jgi:hypothetical protein